MSYQLALQAIAELAAVQEAAGAGHGLGRLAMIVLIGFMGAGKTTVGHLLAERLGLPFMDTDLVIEQRTRRSVRDIFATDGEPAFRQLEHTVTAELLAGPDAVLALGGGAVLHPETQRALGGHQVVYLKVGYDESMLRVAHDEYRPLLRDPDLEGIFQRRLASYHAVATLTVVTDGRRPEAVCLDVVARLAEVPGAPAGTATVLVSCTGGTYNVHVGPGLLADADRLLPALPRARTAVVLASAGGPGGGGAGQPGAAAARAGGQRCSTCRTGSGTRTWPRWPGWRKTWPAWRCTRTT